MKYHIVAKVLGPYLPKRLSINDCKIVKKPFYDSLDYPNLPLREPETEKFVITKGVLNYIQHPQNPVSVRNFQSEYLITVDIKELNFYSAVEEARKKIEESLAAFVLASQNKKMTKGFFGNYYYEIVGAYIKTKKTWIRIKLLNPLTRTHNFFPKPLPKGTTKRARGFLKCKNLTFLKGLEYMNRARKFMDSEYYSELEIVMNLIKCIELIAKKVCKARRVFDKKLGKSRELSTSEIMEEAGKVIRVKKSNIIQAAKGWNARNKSDIAHENDYFLAVVPINIQSLSEAAYDYLIKYFEYIKNKVFF